MSHIPYRHTLVLLLALVAATMAHHASLEPVRVHAAPVAATRHTRVYGTLKHVVEDAAGHGHLDVWSKTRGTRVVYLTPDSVVKRGTGAVPRAALHSGQYVMATCSRDGNGALDAVTVHIEAHAPFANRKKKHT